MSANPQCRDGPTVETSTRPFAKAPHRWLSHDHYRPLPIEFTAADRAKAAGYQQLSELLSLPPDQLPPLRITWSHLTQGPQGELWGRCPKVAIPFLDHQVELADAGYDVVEPYQGIRGRGGIPIIASKPRHEDRSPEALR